METLQHMGILDRVKDRIVTAADIAQAYQFAQSGNAEIAFVAYSQIATNPEGSRWEVPQELYTPIRQDAVLLKKGESDPAAAAFLDYLKGPEAGKIIAKYGYALK
jgi:molybdate transport system substrate-binding protein